MGLAANDPSIAYVVNFIAVSRCSAGMLAMRSSDLGSIRMVLSTTWPQPIFIVIAAKRM